MKNEQLRRLNILKVPSLVENKVVNNDVVGFCLKTKTSLIGSVDVKYEGHEVGKYI